MYTQKSIGEKLRHCHRAKTWWTCHTISIIAKNKLHTHHKTLVHTIKVYKTQPVYSLTIKVFTEVFICSKVINAFKQQNSKTDPFWKSSTSFASIFRKLSSQNIAWWCDMSRFLSQFPRSLLGMPGTMTSFWSTHTLKKEEEKRNACIFRVSQQKQVF